MPVKVIIYMDYSLYFGVDYFYSPFFSDELLGPPSWIFQRICVQTLDTRTHAPSWYLHCNCGHQQLKVGN